MSAPDLFLGADLIGYGGPYVHLLVMVERPTFTALCQHGAAMEDMEEGGDTEPTLGSVEGKGVSQRDWSAGSATAADEEEPSLASTGMLDQRRWNQGEGEDLELDRSDFEPGEDREPVDYVDYTPALLPPGFSADVAKRAAWEPTPLLGKGDQR